MCACLSLRRKPKNKEKNSSGWRIIEYEIGLVKNMADGNVNTEHLYSMWTIFTWFAPDNLGLCGYRTVGAVGRLNDAGLTVWSKLSVWRLGRPSGKQNYNSYNQPRLGCVWVDSKLFCTNTQWVQTLLLTSCLRVNEWLYEWTAHMCEYDVRVGFLSHLPTNKFCFFSSLSIWSLAQTVLCCHNASPHIFRDRPVCHEPVLTLLYTRVEEVWAQGHTLQTEGKHNVWLHLMTPVVHAATIWHRGCVCCSPTLTILTTADTQITPETSKGFQRH